MTIKTELPVASTALDRVARSAPTLILAAAFATAWVAPATMSHDALHSLRTTMVVEFMAIHSGAFLGVLLARAVGSSGGRAASSLALALPLVALYLISAWELSRQTHAWWPLIAAVWLLVARVLPLLRNDLASRDAAIGQLLGEWLCALGVFIASSVLVQNVALPMLGLTGIDAADYPLEGWNTPMTMAQEIQWGALHFFGLALLPWLVPMRAIGAGIEKAIVSSRTTSAARRSRRS